MASTVCELSMLGKILFVSFTTIGLGLPQGDILKPSHMFTLYAYTQTFLNS